MMIFQNYQIKNGMLTTDFGDKEVFETIFHMEHNKTSRSDEVPAEIYLYFWDVIKSDLMAMLAQLQSVDFPLYKLNFDVISAPAQERGCL
jgi:hypothetical protein